MIYSFIGRVSSSVCSSFSVAHTVEEITKMYTKTWLLRPYCYAQRSVLHELYRSRSHTWWPLL